MANVSVEELVITRLTRRGNGKSTPIRIVTEVYTKDGTLVADHDPDFTYSLEQLEKLIEYARKNIPLLTEDPALLLQDWIKYGLE